MRGGVSQAMPDADWVRYKQMRGSDLPETGEWLGTPYRRLKVLKRDFYAVVGVYERTGPSDSAPTHLLVKVYHTEPLGLIPLSWLGRWLCRRETRFLERLNDVPGVPRMISRFGPSGYIREYLPGCNLREYRKVSQPDAEFFPELAAILQSVHDRGVSHNDLSKPENVLVLENGRPCLIDFQISYAPRSRNWPLVGWFSGSFLRYMQRIDRYHLSKLHRRSRPMDFTDEQIAHARRKGVVLTLHGHLLRRPYRAVRHAVLKRYLAGDAESERSEAA